MSQFKGNEYYDIKIYSMTLSIVRHTMSYINIYLVM